MDPNIKQFEEVGDGEPHRIRRKDILEKYPEITEMEGHDVRTAWVTLAVAVAQMFVAWTHAVAAERGTIWGTQSVVLVNAWIFGAILAHWLGQTIHETSHDLAFEKRYHNKLLAQFANLPMLVPIAATFHRYHIGHHTFLGVLGRDTDLPHPMEVKYIGNNPVRKFLWLLGYFFSYLARGATFAKLPNRAEVMNIVVQILFTAWIYKTLGGTAVAYLLLSTILGHSLHPVAGHFIHEHWVFEEGQETNSYYGPLNYVTFNVGYHVEHHDFMNVPGWRLPELHNLAPEYYRPLKSHKSWAFVHLFFIRDCSMHVGNRIVRSLGTFRNTRSLVQSSKDNLPVGRGLLSSKVMGDMGSSSAPKKLE